jgi:hypothetical protein
MPKKLAASGRLFLGHLNANGAAFSLRRRSSSAFIASSDIEASFP